MKLKIFRIISLLSLIVAAGSVSGASRHGMYQAKESSELKKLKRF